MMNQLRINKEKLLPNKVIGNENKNFILLYNEFFSKENFDNFSKLFNEVQIDNLLIEFFDLLEGFEKTISNTENTRSIIPSKDFRNYFYEPFHKNENREFFLDTVYITDDKRNISILINKSSEVVIVSSSIPSLSKNIEIFLRPYVETGIEDKINYLYNCVFFDKKIGKKFINQLVDNYFKNELQL